MSCSVFCLPELMIFNPLSERRAGSSTSSYRKDDYNWRYDGEELPEDVIRASAALENLQLDRKTRNLTSSWRSISPFL